MIDIDPSFRHQIQSRVEKSQALVLSLNLEGKVLREKMKSFPDTRSRAYYQQRLASYFGLDRRFDHDHSRNPTPARQNKTSRIEELTQTLDRLEFYRSTTSMSLPKEKKLLTLRESLARDIQLLEQRTLLATSLDEIESKKRSAQTQVKECQAILTTAERARICGCVSIKDLAQISVVLDAANENIGTIVGKSRQGLRNLEQDFGVQVELVKETKTSAVGLVVSESKSESKEKLETVLKIYGTQANVATTKAYIQRQLALTHADISLSYFPTHVCALLLQHHGALLTQISIDLDLRIDLQPGVYALAKKKTSGSRPPESKSTTPEPNTCVGAKVRGTPSSIQSFTDRLQELGAGAASLTVPDARYLMATIIGTKGQTIQRLQTLAGPEVYMSKQHSTNNNTLSFRGSLSGVNQGLTVVQEFIDSIRHHTLTLTCPPWLASVFRVHHYEGFRTFQRSGNLGDIVVVSLSSRETEKGTETIQEPTALIITLRGTTSALERFQTQTWPQTLESRRKQVLVFDIPEVQDVSYVFALVIGKGGRALAKFSHQHRVELDLDRETRSIYIHNTKDNDNEDSEEDSSKNKNLHEAYQALEELVATHERLAMPLSLATGRLLLTSAHKRSLEAPPPVKQKTLNHFQTLVRTLSLIQLQLRFPPKGGSSSEEGSSSTPSSMNQPNVHQLSTQRPPTVNPTSCCTLTLTGTRDQLIEAKGVVQTWLKNHVIDSSLTLDEPQDVQMLLRNKATLSRLELESGVHQIKILSRVVQLIGSVESIAVAKTLIHATLCPPGSLTLRLGLEFPTTQLKLLIGKGGRSIRKLEKQFPDVTVDTSEAARQVRLKGPEEAVQLCLVAIHTLWQTKHIVEILNLTTDSGSGSTRVPKSGTRGGKSGSTVVPVGKHIPKTPFPRETQHLERYCRSLEQTFAPVSITFLKQEDPEEEEEQQRQLEIRGPVAVVASVRPLVEHFVSHRGQSFLRRWCDLPSAYLKLLETQDRWIEQQATVTLEWKHQDNMNNNVLEMIGPTEAALDCTQQALERLWMFFFPSHFRSLENVPLSFKRDWARHLGRVTPHGFYLVSSVAGPSSSSISSLDSQPNVHQLSTQRPPTVNPTSLDNETLGLASSVKLLLQLPSGRGGGGRCHWSLFSSDSDSNGLLTIYSPTPFLQDTLVECGHRWLEHHKSRRHVIHLGEYTNNERCVPREILVRALVGVGGQNIRDIIRLSEGVSLDILDNDTIDIHGSPRQVALARDHIATFLHRFVSTRVFINLKNEAQVKAVTKRFIVDNDDNDMIRCQILRQRTKHSRGRPSKFVQLTQLDVEQQPDQPSHEEEKKLDCCESSSEELRKNDYHQDNNEEEEDNNNGGGRGGSREKKTLEMLRNEILQVLNEQHQAEWTIPARAVPQVIGKAGKTVQELEHQYHVQIHISDESLVTCQGKNEQDIRHARDAMDTLIVVLQGQERSSSSGELEAEEERVSSISPPEHSPPGKPKGPDASPSSGEERRRVEQLKKKKKKTPNVSSFMTTSTSSKKNQRRRLRERQAKQVSKDLHDVPPPDNNQEQNILHMLVHHSSSSSKEQEEEEEPRETTEQLEEDQPEQHEDDDYSSFSSSRYYQSTSGYSLRL